MLDRVTLPHKVVVHRAELAMGLGVGALSVIAIFAWFFWGRATQMAVALGVLGTALTYFRYLEIATAISGFIILSSISSFLPGSTSLFFVGTFVVLMLRKVVAGDFRWRLGVFPFAGILFVAYVQITGLWANQGFFYEWSPIFRILPAVIVMSELMDSVDRYIALFVGAAIGIIFTSVTSIHSAYEFYTSGIADQIATSVRSIESTRFFGHWSNPNIMSMTITAFLGGVIALWRSKVHFSIRVLMFAASITGFAAVLISMSRTGIVGCAIIFAMILAVDKRRFTLATVFAVIVGVLLIVLPVDLFGRIASIIGGGDQSTSERLQLLLAGWDMYWKNPIFGIGMGGFQNEVLYYVKYLSIGFIAHNSLVDIAVDGGIVGVALFLITLFYSSSGLTWRDWTIRNDDSAAMINAGLRASFVATCFSIITMTAHTYVPFWVLFAICSVYSGAETKNVALSGPASA